MSPGIIALISGTLGAFTAVVAAYIKGRRDGASRSNKDRAEGYAQTRKRMDDAPKYLDPDAARDAMRVRDPKRK